MKRTVYVNFTVEVEVDETKFTPEFMEEFRHSFYEFTTIEQHLEHLAQLFVRGIAAPYNDFIEGYGLSEEFGIRFKAIDQEEYCAREVKP